MSFSQIRCGGNHIIGLIENKVYTWGTNQFGQLGTGNCNSYYNPNPISINKESIIFIAAGYSFSSCITEEGKIYSWGSCENGRLGINNLEELEEEYDLNKIIKSPTQLDFTFKAKKLFANSMNQISLSEDKKIYIWGSKYYCGFKTEEDILTPTLILNEIDFYDISTGIGSYHFLALSMSGDLYTWGHNQVGQLGNDIIYNNLNDEKEPIVIEPIKINYLDNLLIKEINTGWGHSSILTFGGQIYLCGRNYKGQIAIDPDKCQRNKVGHPYVCKFTLVKDLLHENIDKVICGGEHTAAITKDNKLYLWGSNQEKQLIKNNLEYSFKPILISNNVQNVCLGCGITILVS